MWSRRRLQQQIAALLDARGDLAPPWARFPEIPCGSIGWRMGAGESWMMLWCTWLPRLPRRRIDRLLYLRRHPPAPRPWADTALWVYEPRWEDISSGEEAQLRAQLEAAGVIGDDVSFLAWDALYGRDPATPWDPPWHDDTLTKALRFRARDLNFWARWCATRRASAPSELVAYFDRLARAERVPPADSCWRPIHDAAASGRPPTSLPRDGRARLAVLLAAHGEVPPPWVLGEPAASLTETFDGDVSYADAWYAWALSVFDDVATWRAYLERHGPRAPEWDAALARSMRWVAFEDEDEDEDERAGEA